MSFVFIAIGSYFLTASATILDKFIISSKRVGHPAEYTFFVGLFSAFTLIIFFPFGFHLIAFGKMLVIFLFSSLYLFGLLSLFFAFRKNEASRVVPVVGVVTTLTSFLISLLIFKDVFNPVNLWGIPVLLLGGILISLKISKSNLVKIFSSFHLAVLSGFFLGIAFSSFEYFYKQDNFFNVFIWTRLGVFLGALSLLSVPFWRRKIFASFKKPKNKKAEKKNIKTGLLFLTSKLLGGLGSVTFNLAISLGSVAIVNALVATEYVFVFFMSLLFSQKYPTSFKEKMDIRTIIQKTVAIFIIAIGVAMVAA